MTEVKESASCGTILENINIHKMHKTREFSRRDVWRFTANGGISRELFNVRSNAEIQSIEWPRSVRASMMRYEITRR